MGAPGTRPAAGWFFEDYRVGQRLPHAAPRTLTPGDAALYLALYGGRNPVHCAAPVAAALGHRDTPLDDLLVFHVAFGKTVHDVSYNAVANLGYADLRFQEPVYPGDTVSAESEVIGLRENSNGRSGVVWVRSRAANQHGREILSWVRWVMVAKRDPASPAPAPEVPELPPEVPVSRLAVPAFLRPRALDPRATGCARLWDDYEPGETIDHPGGVTVEEADHMLATRLYQNTARVHFDAFAARDNAFGRRLVYGGHVISIARALSHDGLGNAFAIAAIHGGTHANPTFAGDTILARTVVTAREAVRGRDDVGALRVRLLAAKNAALAGLATPAPGGKHPAFVLDLDLTLLLPRR
jgi:2-methylfumaryl-CoA hydratase